MPCEVPHVSRYSRLVEGRELDAHGKNCERVDGLPKGALYLAMKEAAISKAALARTLQIDEKEVRRLLDPHHPSKLPRMEEALRALGKRLVLSLQPAVTRRS